MSKSVYKKKLQRLEKETRKKKEKKTKPRQVAGKAKAYLKDAVYVLPEYVDTDYILEEYTTRIYDDKICDKCDNLIYRHNYLCQKCPLGGYKETIHLSNFKDIGNRTYLRLPIGDRHRLVDFGISKDNFIFLDKRTQRPLYKEIQFTGKLRPHQQEAAKDIIKAGYGILEAPPRSGKTITGIYIALKLGLRTLILADQHDFLKGFEEHIQKYTNLPELEEELDRKLFGFPSKIEDFKKYQICICTYQQFISATKGNERLTEVNKYYGTLIIDEVHKGNSTCFSRVIGSISAKHKIGLTGTPERKDNRHFIVQALVGPVKHVVNVESLKPVIVLHDTKISPPGGYKYSQWQTAMRFLSKNVKRNEMIINYAIKDIRNGRSLVIPLTFKDHISTIVDGINSAFGKEVAQAFVGGGGKANKLKRESIIENCRSGKTKAIVGIRSLLQLGLNVEVWDTLYMVIPISNEPNWKQESSRILTPLEGKKPVIRMFVDVNMGQSVGCFRNTYRQSMKFGYLLSKKSKSKLSYFMGKPRKEENPEDEFKPHYEPSGSIFGRRNKC